MSTLKTLVDYFETFADNHLQINSFDYGHITKVDTNSSKINGVLMFMTWRPSFWTNGIPTISFSFWIMDRVDIEQSNLIDVQSDCLSIAHDLLSDVNNTDETWVTTLKNSGTSIEIFEERFSSMYGGCIVDIDIKLPKGLDSCAIPNE